MAIKEVEGSKFTKEITGNDLLEWMAERQGITKEKAKENLKKSGIKVEED